MGLVLDKRDTSRSCERPSSIILVSASASVGPQTEAPDFGTHSATFNSFLSPRTVRDSPGVLYQGLYGSSFHQCWHPRLVSLPIGHGDFDFSRPAWRSQQSRLPSLPPSSTHLWGLSSLRSPLKPLHQLSRHHVILGHAHTTKKADCGGLRPITSPTILIARNAGEGGNCSISL